MTKHTTFNRRRFLHAASAAAAGPVSAQNGKSISWTPVDSPPPGLSRVWTGPGFWANRLQDWSSSNGRLECVNATDSVRTLAILTRELQPSKGIARVSVRASRIAGQNGFCGFLIGAGAGKLDWRSAALVQQASGEGGGILCVWESDGKLRFREHTDEANPHLYKELAPFEQSGSIEQSVEVELRLTISTSGERGQCELEAFDGSDRRVARAVINGVNTGLHGGVLLVSSPTGQEGSRYAFRDLRTSGSGVGIYPDRTFGPIIGTLYSLNGSVLKLSAQLCPVAATEPQVLTLEIRNASGDWRTVSEARIESGFVAVFRITSWDATKQWHYRVRYGSAMREGTIGKDPNGSSLTIGMINCVAPVARNLDGGAPLPPLQGTAAIGRYTPESIAFPFTSLVKGVSEKRPDVLVFSGDQIYEGRPTRTDPSPSPTLDYLYKWSLWHWAFGELTRNLPAIVQVDDHDMYQGNIWGQGGRPAPEDDQNRGGYVRDAAWVNMVQRTQCAHNPDPWDPTPIQQGISVYYGSFRFGGVSFAILEDRKFKTGAIPDSGADPAKAQLLGDRQEQFLADWAKERRSDIRICLTQTTFACVQTGPQGEARRDPDSNGYPKHARDRALKLIADAGAIILSGDQHLTHVVRHEIEGSADGPYQFTAPAGASLFARWFEPAGTLPNSSGLHTGDFADGFGNRFRMIAVANPDVSFAEYRKQRPARGQGVEDARLRTDGFGIVRVNKSAAEFILECWPAGNNPAHPLSRQFAGWPVRIGFNEVQKKKG